ncbi:MAG: RIO-like serine/threonine protein kinase [Candidatus Nanohaloarchaea archaeon]|jgi:RIO-like serine/threonine protein kinase
MSEYDFSNVDPEAFDWLDYAEEFFKHDGDFDYGRVRTIPARNGKSYVNIEDEFRQLEEMYEAAPDKVAEPLMTLEKNGEVRGFYIERVEGEHITDYFSEGKGDIERHLEILDKVEEFVNTMGEEGLVHGDLSNNILYDGERIKVIDPVGQPEEQEDFEIFRELDEGSLQVLENRSPYLWSQS